MWPWFLCPPPSKLKSHSCINTTLLGPAIGGAFFVFRSAKEFFRTAQQFFRNAAWPPEDLHKITVKIQSALKYSSPIWTTINFHFMMRDSNLCAMHKNPPVQQP